jgi:O-antigen ligase
MTESIASKSRLIAFYLLTGFFASLTFSIALAQMLMGATILFALVSLIGRRERNFPSGFKWFFISVILFVGWSVIASLCGSTALKSLLVNKEEWLFLIIPITAYLASDKKKISILITALAISTFIVAVYAGFQHFSGLDLLEHATLPKAPEHGYRVVGTFSNRLTFGDFFVVAAIFILTIAPSISNSKRKFLFYASFASASLAVVFTYSRGPLAVLAISVIILIVSYIRRQLKVILLIFLLLMVSVVVFTPDILSGYFKSARNEWEGSYPGSRLSVWKTTIKMTAAHPLFGIGQGNFEEQFKIYREPNSKRIYAHGHNDVLNIAAYSGIPGAIFYLGFWIVMFGLMAKVLKQAQNDSIIRAVMIGAIIASIAFFMTSTYEATFADEEPRQLLMALWGLFIGCAGIVKCESGIAD